jgi:hypothetical protein
MKILIEVKRISQNFYEAGCELSEYGNMRSMPSQSFFYSLVDLGERCHQFFNVDILDPEHELTIKLLK